MIVLPRTGLRCTACPQWPLPARHYPIAAAPPPNELEQAPPNSVLTVEQGGVMQAYCRSHAIMALGPRRVREALGEMETKA